MTIRNLNYLFEPQSVAVIGASKKPHSVGATVLNNLVVGGFAGTIMPVNPKSEDGAWHVEFFNALNPEDVRYRVFTWMRELQPSQLGRLTQIDYDREMAFIAVKEIGNGKLQTIGGVRAITDPDNINAEFAIIVRSDLKGQGMGRILMKKMIDYCRLRGTKSIVGEALLDNRRLVDLVNEFSFEVSPMPGDNLTLRLHLVLAKGADQPRT